MFWVYAGEFVSRPMQARSVVIGERFGVELFNHAETTKFAFRAVPISVVVFVFSR